jgi:hypothetical protein
MGGEGRKERGGRESRDEEGRGEGRGGERVGMENVSPLFETWIRLCPLAYRARPVSRGSFLSDHPGPLAVAIQ